MDFGPDFGKLYCNTAHGFDRIIIGENQGALICKPFGSQKRKLIGYINPEGVVKFINRQNTVQNGKVTTFEAFKSDGELFPVAQFFCEPYEGDENNLFVTQVGGEFIAQYTMFRSGSYGLGDGVYQAHAFERIAKKTHTNHLIDFEGAKAKKFWQRWQKSKLGSSELEKLLNAYSQADDWDSSQRMLYCNVCKRENWHKYSDSAGAYICNSCKSIWSEKNSQDETCGDPGCEDCYP